MITQKELKEIIEAPETFVPVADKDCFELEAPRFLLEDIGKCFDGLRAFVRNGSIRGMRINYQDVKMTYEALEGLFLPYLLQKRTLFQRMNRQATLESLALLAEYRDLRAQCEAKRRLAA